MHILSGLQVRAVVAVLEKDDEGQSGRGAGQGLAKVHALSFPFCLIIKVSS